MLVIKPMPASATLGRSRAGCPVLRSGAYMEDSLALSPIQRSWQPYVKNYAPNSTFDHGNRSATLGLDKS